MGSEPVTPRAGPLGGSSEPAAAIEQAGETRTRDRALRLLMLLRVVLITALLLIAIAVEVVSEVLAPINPLYLLIAATYALTVVYALALRRWGSTAPLIYVQIIADLLVTTGLVYLTGGEGTRLGFALLYPLSVLSGSVLLYRRAGLVLAVVATTLFAGTLLAVHTRVVPPAGLVDIPLVPAKVLLFSVLLVAVACHAVALTGAYLSEGLRRTGRELNEATDRVANLEELNQVIVESMHSGLMITDVDGRIQHLNDFGANILGLPAEDARGRPVGEILGSGLDTSVLRARALRRDLSRLGLDHTRRSGIHLPIGLAVSPLVATAGAHRGFLIVFQDLTEVKRLESEVRTKEKLAAVGEVAAQLAHEIRNPLGSIHGSAQLLLSEQAGAGLSTDQAQLLEIIRKESLRLSDNLNQFLLQVRVSPRPLSPADLGPVVAELAALLRNGSEVTAAHTVTVDIGPGPHVCLVDADRIRQVFWNLTRNALEAMPDGGLLEVALKSRGAFVELTVRDEGGGLDQRQVFTLLRSPAGGIPGGLGLALVCQIVREHRGDIFFQRAPPSGTCVKVVLPRVGEEVAG
jgi:two-component system, NtrC family, sensor histidine kinase PilS